MDRIVSEFFKHAVRSKKQSDKVVGNLQSSVQSLNRKYNRRTRSIYDRILNALELTPGGMIAPGPANHAILAKAMPAFDKMIEEYKGEYAQRWVDHRVQIFVALKLKEDGFEKILRRAGVKENRTGLTKDDLAHMNNLNDNHFIKIGNMLVKWRNFMYDTFSIAFSRGMTVMQLKGLLFTEDGKIKIGSSLEETSEAEASIAAVEQRIAYVQAKAKEEGYTYCWNVNPLDRRTKPDCIQASLAGVVPEEVMGSQYGFPPRFICRCDLAYVRKEWTEFNNAINGEIRLLKSRLLEELINAPKQLSSWYVGRTLVVPKDPVRASGDKMYKEIEDKIALVGSLEVPEFQP